MAAPAARFRGRRGSPAQGGADAPGSARTARRWRGRSYWLRGECARPSSPRSGDGSMACARARWCGDGSRWRANERQSAGPSERSRRRVGSAAPRLRYGQSDKGPVEVTFELDMVVNADPTEAPLGKAIGLGRQCIEVGPVQLFEQPPAGDAEPADPALVIELAQ